MGDLVVHSALGQPLRAELRLTPAAGESIEPDCLLIVAPATASADDLPWIRNARLSLQGNRLRITTREPINHPAAMLSLRMTCGVDLQRDYPILLQPPIEHASTPEISPPTAANALPSPRPRGTPAHRSSQTVAVPVGKRSDHAGQPTVTARNKTTRTGTGKNRHGDRLILSKDKNPALRLDYQLSHPPATADTQEPPAGKSTVSAYDASVSAQLELDEKIKRLEEYQTVLRQRIAELDRQEAARHPAPEQPPPEQATAAPPPPARPMPPAAPQQANVGPGAMPDWLIALGGIVAVIAGGLALMWMRKRRAETGSATEVDAELPDETSYPREPVIESHTEAAAIPAVPPAQAAPTALPAIPLTPQSYAQQAAPDEATDWTARTFAPAHPIPFDETVDEQDSALELAEIMMSFGRTQGAAETLADYIRHNPRQAVKPWLKLLDVYHVAGMRAEFEALTRQLNKTFNVKTITWADFKASRAAPDSIEQMEHVTHQLQELWGTREAQVYIHQLLRDNRNGTRQGFPLNVIEELLLLVAVLDDTLGTYRPNLELTLADLEPSPASKAA
ncbi:MAG: hypothetical protein JSR83_27250 [Proteobacteria bacterium]|nr:hypothetical protein [Pseudomonadota bacterium]